jgi:hypothetical protein
MRILFCNKYNFAFSGTEVYLFELMDLMRSHGHEVALFSMADPRGEPTKYDQHFVPAINFKSAPVQAPSETPGVQPMRSTRARHDRNCARWLRPFIPTSPTCATSTITFRPRSSGN